MDVMFRVSCAADSSKAMYRHFCPPRQMLSANAAARLVLPVPALPDTRMLLPR